jgi:hypothetical protein
MAVDRQALLRRIAALSEDEIERIGPYLEADLDTLIDLDALRDEIELGRASATREPLVGDDHAIAEVEALLSRR